MPCLEAVWTWPAVAALLVVGAIIATPIIATIALLWMFVRRWLRLRTDDCTDALICFLLVLLVGGSFVLFYSTMNATTGEFLATVKCPGVSTVQGTVS